MTIIEDVLIQMMVVSGNYRGGEEICALEYVPASAGTR